MNKRLLCPQRLRHVPRQFSWIDHRLLRDGHIARCGGPRALALYLLLVAASDAQGLSLEPAMGRAEPPAPRTAETLSMSEALRRMFEAGGTSEATRQP